VQRTRRVEAEIGLIMEEATGHGQKDRLIASSGVSEQALPGASLYVVGLPIGNAADLTLRAWWVLSRVDAIAAEDTRVTRPLLQRYGIDTALIAAHRHNEQAAAQAIVEQLQRGARIALVSDAGTPGISDPGAAIVRAVSDAGMRVIPVPGASSLAAALSVAGLVDTSFRFVGFLPTGARERERTLRALLASGEAIVLLEAPHRIRALAQLLSRLADGARQVVFARELTKKFESIVRSSCGSLAAETLDERGEYVVLIDTAGHRVQTDEVDAETRRWLQALLEDLPPARAAAVAARASGCRKDELYALALRLKTGPAET
jgi:16S rRNA (cytidine1402-2'-O)-methyltransferase